MGAFFADDLSTLLAGASVGTPGTNIFFSTKAAPPQGAASLVIVETPGAPPEFVHNENQPHFIMPGAQIAAVADDYPTARALAKAAWNALRGQYNVTINGTFYRAIHLTSVPADGGLNAQGRPTSKFNVRGDRQP